MYVHICHDCSHVLRMCNSSFPDLVVIVIIIIEVGVESPDMKMYTPVFMSHPGL